MSEEGQAADKAAAEKKEPESKSGYASDKAGGDGGKAGGDEATLKLPAEEMVKRRSRWQSSLAALRYVSSVSRDNEVKVRDSDRASSIALLIVCAIALISLVLPQLATQRHIFVAVSDVLVGVCLLMYVANRFGIVTTLTPRQALLAYQLMLGSALLGIFLAINLTVVIAFVVANTHIEVPR